VADPASPIPDPAAAWRSWISQSEQQWNALLNQAMGSDQYSQWMGRMMETYVMMQKNMAESMSRYLGALNMPTRTDILTLGDRLAMIEDRLAGIERMLTAAGTSAAPADGATAAAMRPPRTKQPASGPGTGMPPAGESRGT
jgi:polyhydroxyalkanoic acid synthase PhaR subunit